MHDRMDTSQDSPIRETSAFVMKENLHYHSFTSHKERGKDWVIVFINNFRRLNATIAHKTAIHDELFDTYTLG